MQKHFSRPRTIVVLHGWTLDPAVTDKWQPFIQLLEKAGFTVKFWQLPGLTVETKQPLTLDDYVAWLKQKTNTLESFILLGHSFGGQLAVRFASLYPEKISQLILVDSSGITDPSWSKVFKRAAFKLIAKAGKVITRSVTLRQWLYKLARETDYYDANEQQRQTMKNVLSTDVMGDLPSLSMPTLLIWGEKDTVTPLTIAKIFAKNIPGAKLQLIAGARHSPVYTHPQETLSVIQNFLPT